MIGAGVDAADKGIEPLDLVGKAVLHQEIQRPVHHRRLRTEPLGAQHLEQVIGPHCTMLREQHLERAAPHRSELQPPGDTIGVGGGNATGLASLVIVLVKAHRVHILPFCVFRLDT